MIEIQTNAHNSNNKTATTKQCINRTAPHRTAPHRTAPHRTTPHHTTPHHTTPHHTTPHHTTPHHTTPPTTAWQTVLQRLIETQMNTSPFPAKVQAHFVSSGTCVLRRHTWTVVSSELLTNQRFKVHALWHSGHREKQIDECSLPLSLGRETEVRCEREETKRVEKR